MRVLGKRLALLTAAAAMLALAPAGTAVAAVHSHGTAPLATSRGPCRVVGKAGHGVSTHWILHGTCSGSSLAVRQLSREVAKQRAADRMPAAVPLGSARNYPLRDDCGGANTNLNWSGTGISTWGVLWNSKCGSNNYNLLSLFYGEQGDLYLWFAPPAYKGPGIGYDSGTLHHPLTINYVEEDLCQSTNNLCQDHVFAS